MKASFAGRLREVLQPVEHAAFHPPKGLQRRGRSEVEKKLGQRLGRLTNLEFGIGEGYYFDGPDTKDTSPRLFTMAYQGSWLARMYQQAVDSKINSLMSWRWGTATFSGIDTLNAHIGNLTHKPSRSRSPAEEPVTCSFLLDTNAG